MLCATVVADPITLPYIPSPPLPLMRDNEHTQSQSHCHCAWLFFFADEAIMTHTCVVRAHTACPHEVCCTSARAVVITPESSRTSIKNKRSARIGVVPLTSTHHDQPVANDNSDRSN